MAVIHGSMINSWIVIPRNLPPYSCTIEMLSKQLLVFDKSILLCCGWKRINVDLSGIEQWAFKAWNQDETWRRLWLTILYHIAACVYDKEKFVSPAKRMTAR